MIQSLKEKRNSYKVQNPGPRGGRQEAPQVSQSQVVRLTFCCFVDVTSFVISIE